MTLADMSYETRTALYLIGVFEELKKAGLIAGGFHKATFKGKAAFDQLHASGFRPAEEDMDRAIRFGFKVEDEETRKSFLVLIKNWNEGKIT